MLESEVPTRAEVFDILNGIAPQSGLAQEKADRNTQRKQAVQAAFPVDVFEKIESDLPSYTVWEEEIDDEA